MIFSFFLLILLNGSQVDALNYSKILPEGCSQLPIDKESESSECSLSDACSENQMNDIFQLAIMDEKNSGFSWGCPVQFEDFLADPSSIETWDGIDSLVNTNGSTRVYSVLKEIKIRSFFFAEQIVKVTYSKEKLFFIFYGFEIEVILAILVFLIGFSLQGNGTSFAEKLFRQGRLYNWDSLGHLILISQCIGFIFYAFYIGNMTNLMMQRNKEKGAQEMSGPESLMPLDCRDESPEFKEWVYYYQIWSPFVSEEVTKETEMLLLGWEFSLENGFGSLSEVDKSTKCSGVPITLNEVFKIWWVFLAFLILTTSMNIYNKIVTYHFLFKKKPKKKEKLFKNNIQIKPNRLLWTSAFYSALIRHLGSSFVWLEISSVHFKAKSAELIYKASLKEHISNKVKSTFKKASKNSRVVSPFTPFSGGAPTFSLSLNLMEKEETGNSFRNRLAKWVLKPKSPTKSYSLEFKKAMSDFSLFAEFVIIESLKIRGVIKRAPVHFQEIDQTLDVRHFVESGDEFRMKLALLLNQLCDFYKVKAAPLTKSTGKIEGFIHKILKCNRGDPLGILKELIGGARQLNRKKSFQLMTGITRLTLRHLERKADLMFRDKSTKRSFRISFVPENAGKKLKEKENEEVKDEEEEEERGSRFPATVFVHKRCNLARLSKSEDLDGVTQLSIVDKSFQRSIKTKEKSQFV